MSSPDAVHRAYIPAIDGMRAISILSVLLYHLDARLLPGGFVGVDVFFAISGFVVSKSVFGYAHLPLLPFITTFYRRRVLRVLPPMIVFVVMVMAVSVLLLPVAALSRANDAVGMLAPIGLANFALWYFAGDYFSPTTAFNPLTHMWSLAVEEQFYVLFPFMTGLLFASPRHGRLAKAALVALGVASLGASAWLTRGQQAFAYYMLPTRLWELVAGVLLFVTLESGTRRDTVREGVFEGAKGTFVGVVAVLLLAASFLWADDELFPFPWAIPPMMASLILLSVSTLTPDAPLARWLSWPPMVYVGRISYALYLWHFGVIVLMRWTVGIDSPLQRIVAAALSFALAAASDVYVERPIRTSAGLARRSNARVALGGLAACATAAGVIGALVLARPHLSLSATRDDAVWSFRAPDRFERDGCRVDRERADRHGAYVVRFARDGCLGGPSRRLVVVGDSHAGSYENLLQQLSAVDRIDVEVFQRPGCDLLRLSEGSRELSPACVSYFADVLGELQARLGEGDVLFLPGLRIPRFRDQWDSAVVENTTLAEAGNAAPVVVHDDVLRDLRPLIERNVRVVIEAPKPVFRTAPFRCADPYTRGNPYCAAGFDATLEELEERRAPVLGAMRRLVGQSPSFSVWDPMPALCPHSPCSAFRGGVPVYFDGDHLSHYGNELLLEGFRAHLARL